MRVIFSNNLYVSLCVQGDQIFIPKADFSSCSSAYFFFDFGLMDLYSDIRLSAKGESEAFFRYLEAQVMYPDETDLNWNSRRLGNLEYSASRGYPPALFQLAELAHFESYRDPIKMQEAFELYGRAAQCDHLRSMWLYAQSKLTGKDEERNSAIEMLIKSARLGCEPSLRLLLKLVEEGEILGIGNAELSEFQRIIDELELVT